MGEQPTVKYTVRKNESDGTGADVQLAVRDLKGTFIVPSPNTLIRLQKALSGKASGDTDFGEDLEDYLGFISKGAGAYSDVTIDVLDADAGLNGQGNIGSPDEMNAICGLSMTDNTNRIFVYQSGGPMSLSKLSTTNQKGVPVEMRNLRIGDLINSFSNYAKGGESLKEISLPALIDEFRALQLAQGEKKTVQWLEHFGKGEDGAMAYVNPNGVNSNYIAFTSNEDPKDPIWHGYIAQRSKGAYVVTASRFRVNNGSVDMDSVSVRLGDDGKILAASTLHNGKKDRISLATRGKIIREVDGMLLTYNANSGRVISAYKSVAGEEGAELTSVPVQYGQLSWDSAQRFVQNLYEQAKARTEGLLSDKGIAEKIKILGQRLKYAANGQDLMDSPTDNLLKPSEFRDMSVSPISR